ncbi:MAG: ATP-binding protein [Anaerolineales bacterium]|jgi:signal transduction histidine kinase|nr:ATP-binding protein [Anaerolineales bacterium]
MGDATIYLPILFAFLPVIAYLVLLILAIRRLRSPEQLTDFLAIFLAIGLLLEIGAALSALGWWNIPAETLALITQIGSVLLVVLMAQMIRMASIPMVRHWPFWLVLGWMIALVALKSLLLVFGSWLVFAAWTVFLLQRAIRKAHMPILRNRMTYWVIVLILLLGNDILLFYYSNWQGNLLRLGAAIALGFVIMRSHLPDVRDIVRQFMTYLTSTVIIILVYIAIFWAAQRLFGTMTIFNPLLAGAGVAVLISLIFSPLLGMVRHAYNTLFQLEVYDPSQILREYSTSISNILDLEKLATLAVGLIMEALEINKGLIFLVDPEFDENKQKIYRLSPIRGAGSLPSGNAVFSEDSSIARFFLEKREALLQYDVDFAPTFMDAPIRERKWMSGLGIDVYVPIYSKGDWIGLLALGPKGSGLRYTEEDLNLLAAMASQTGVALENARLVENLRKLNDQIREAYSFLDKANHDLASLETTKSNFISIASHELRTPLTVARGYAEMLMEDPSLPEQVRGLVKGIHKSTLRQVEIMDSMFDIAQLDASVLELHRQDVFLTELARSVTEELTGSLAERELTLSVDLPQLPAIKADPNTMRKLFHHLLTNAIKFTPNGGNIKITGRQLPPNNRDLPEGGVEIIVSDSGVGVDKGSQEVIFTKFYQPGEQLNRHSTGKTKFKGSGAGLGLALSRGIVNAHGGKIWVESEGNDEEKCPGSDFHVILPLRSQGESKTVRMGSAVKLKL